MSQPSCFATVSRPALPVKSLSYSFSERDQAQRQTFLSTSLQPCERIVVIGHFDIVETLHQTFVVRPPRSYAFRQMFGRACLITKGFEGLRRCLHAYNISQISIWYRERRGNVESKVAARKVQTTFKTRCRCPCPSRAGRHCIRYLCGKAAVTFLAVSYSDGHAAVLLAPPLNFPSLDLLSRNCFDQYGIARLSSSPFGYFQYG
jgi:hypothetical protein